MSSKTDPAPPPGDAAEPKRSAHAPSAERYEVTLPSGRVASILARGKGKHVRHASRLAGSGASEIALTLAMIAVKCLVDGKPLTVEDVDELDDSDVWVLMGKVMGGKGAGSPPST